MTRCAPASCWCGDRMPVGIDTGNPNVFKLYRGMYEMNMVDGVTSSDDARVMLTISNIVMLLGDIAVQSYSEGDRLATMPYACRPASDIVLPVALVVGVNRSIEMLTIESDGMMSIGTDIQGGVVKTGGMSYNIGARYYRKQY